MDGILRFFRRVRAATTFKRLVTAFLWCALIALILFAEKAGEAPFFTREGWLLATYVAGLSMALTGAITFATRRVMFSLIATLLFLAAVTLLSKTKQAFLHVRLLYSDIHFYLRDWAEITFFVEHYSYLAIGAAVALLIAAFVAATVYIKEKGHTSRRVGASIFAVGSAVAGLGGYGALTAQMKADVFYQAAYDQRHISTLIVSAISFAEAFDRPMSIDVPEGTDAATVPVPGFKEENAAGERPTIIVVLHESSVDPAIYFQGDQYQVPSAFFESGDGKRRRMDVEIYGGRTWISEYGFLLGLNASYLGAFYEFLGIIREGRFRNTLPLRLKDLGYLTVANYPSSRSFMNTGRFYTSLGFDVIDSPVEMRLAEIGRPLRDIDYYNHVLKDLSRRSADGKSDPVFYFVWTTATHYPYQSIYWPDVRSEEIVHGDQAAEFARRQRVAHDDLMWFEAQLKERFPQRKFLIAGFGDHHPLITNEYLLGLPALNVRSKDPNEPSDLTYYRISGINFDPDYDALSDYIEIGYLAESVLTAARLPLGPSFAIRSWLRRHCSGRWLTCPDVGAVRYVNKALSRGPVSLLQ